MIEDEAPSASSGAVEVRFEVLADDRWSVPKPGDTSVVALGLRITNDGATPVRFVMFDTAVVAMATPDGERLARTAGRNTLLATDVLSPPIESGEAYEFSLDSELVWFGSGTRLRLIGPDGYGGTWYFDDLEPGTYTLWIEYTNAAPGEGDDTDVWVGVASTPPIQIEVIRSQ